MAHPPSFGRERKPSSRGPAGHILEALSSFCFFCRPRVYFPCHTLTVYAPHQAVYELYEVVPGPDWQPGEARVTRMVIIGRNLRPAAIKASWMEFLSGPGKEQAAKG